MKRYLVIALTILALAFSMSSCKKDKDPVEHTHTPTTSVTENVVEAGFDYNGSYDSVYYCATCGNEIGRVNVTTPMLMSSYSVYYQDLFRALDAVSNTQYTKDELVQVLSTLELTKDTPTVNVFTAEQLYGIYFYEEIDNKEIKLSKLLAHLGRTVASSDGFTAELDSLFKNNVSDTLGGMMTEEKKELLNTFCKAFEEDLLPAPDGTVTKARFKELLQMFGVEGVNDAAWIIAFGSKNEVTTPQFLNVVKKQYIGMIVDEDTPAGELVNYVLENSGTSKNPEFKNYETFYNLINETYTYDEVIDAIEDELIVYYEILFGEDLNKTLEKNTGVALADMDIVIQRFYIDYFAANGMIPDATASVSQLSAFMVTKIDSDVMLQKLCTDYVYAMLKAFCD